MIDDLLTYVRQAWPLWFDEESAPRLEIGILGSRPSHEDRALVFVASASQRSSWLVLKVALSRRGAESLRHEHAALRNVRGAAPSDVRSSIPEPLAQWSLREATVLAIRGVDGHRLVVPALVANPTAVSRFLLRSFLTRAFRWSDQLARTTSAPSLSDAGELAQLIERFRRTFPLRPGTAADVVSFERAVDRAHIQWLPAWQHSDVGFGNALTRRGRLRFVDWEHAQASAPPWFDIAYAPASLAGLAQRQGRLPSVVSAAAVLFRPRAWVGDVVHAEMHRIWRHPVPVSWAITTTVMWKALRLRSEGRDGWAELASALVADRAFRRRAGWLAPEW